ncbi:MAG: DNA mismatch repair endonuclease MutL, partial [Ignavibacteria bacterium]|nr:DNA mismatch repair endonuclease MutL [Ignavibacteria bacterium]
AAGEVVQRPESVVKELIENSIDARANHISLVIKDAGKSLIQVIDDGSGMSKEDVKLAFQRHSTSKISKLEDLNNIQTLGFRGEALYSISAVARVEVKTKTEDSELGTFTVFEGGKEIENSDTNCEKGTNISVKNLFFNLPARRKFLKSNATEFKHIYDTFQRAVFSHPNIRFTLIDDEKLVFDLKPSSLEKRIQYFYGESFIESLISISESYDEISIYGYIGAPHFAKKNRGEQFLFLNNRFIQNKSINHAVYRGYEHLIEKGEFPFFMLFLNIDPRKIDVNVHPAKLEVKFDDEQFIYSTILSAVRNSLTKFDISPSIELIAKNDLNEKTKFKSPAVEMNPFLAKEIYGIKNPNLSQAKRDTTSRIEEVENLFSRSSIIEQTKNLIANESVNVSEISNEAIPSRAVWQIHNKYILTPIKSGLMIIDQHIAHERILYEKAIERIENNIAPSQQLLFPQTVELSPPDFDLVME